MDQLLEETIVTLHPDTRATRVSTNALRHCMETHSERSTIEELVALVTTDYWRYRRHEVIRDKAQEWMAVEPLNERQALWLGEVEVMAIEALAGRWLPEQCRVMVVRIDDERRMSLVCNMEGFSA